ncbi:helix-turn-helix domain-containing protein [Kitasatospora sp. LaBMicrA B282]|uniref:helix-turn-helix domain-containing protein n=1 Tax=Kitasatospora sp. LaBMicrA B282 TaxID=3420949 RepID=UPI003D11B63C
MATRKQVQYGPAGSNVNGPRTWGSLLKGLREDAGLTQAQVADRVTAHPSTISHLESGRDQPTLEWAVMLDRAIGSDGRLATAYELVSPYLSLPHPDWDFFEYLRAESQAVRIHDFQAGRVSGLLQTENYMRALFRAHNPSETAEEIARRTQERLDRQALLARSDAPLLVSLIEEACLRRPVGSLDIMREELEHLLRMMEHPRVLIQVVPFGSGEGAGQLLNSMIILEMPTGQRRIYSESLARGHFLDPGLHRRFVDLFEHCRALALPQAESAALIRRLKRDLGAAETTIEAPGPLSPLEPPRPPHPLRPRKRVHLPRARRPGLAQ